MAYFREDIALNEHHRHWHEVYPFQSVEPSIVDKDRRGELLYYMHQQIMARYTPTPFSKNENHTYLQSLWIYLFLKVYFSHIFQKVQF